MLDFRVPHGLDMVEGIRVGNGETQNHHVGSGGRERKVTGRESWWGVHLPLKRGTRVCLLLSHLSLPWFYEPTYTLFHNRDYNVRSRFKAQKFIWPHSYLVS